MKFSRSCVTALAAALALGGCSTLEDNPKQAAGTVLGGIGGAVIGSQFGGGTGKIAATAAGTMLGAWLGNEVGASLDRADRQYAEQAVERAHTAPVGESIAWNNPESGNSGTVTAMRDGQSNTGRYCREYRTNVTIDGRHETAYGTACRQSDGTWEMVN